MYSEQFLLCATYFENWVSLKPVLRGVRDVALIHYPSCTQSNQVSILINVILLWLMLPRDHFVSRFLYFTTASVKCCVSAVKMCPFLHFSVVICFGPSGSLIPALLSVENWEMLKPQLGGVRDFALILYPSCTDSIKPSLQFLCHFVVINASEGSLCFQFLLL
jgi:hypothetical protein